MKSDGMRAQYDFVNAERGKFYRPLDKGYKVHVRQDDGTEIVNHYTLAEGMVPLAPDVREYLSDSEAGKTYRIFQVKVINGIWLDKLAGKGCFTTLARSDKRHDPAAI